MICSLSPSHSRTTQLRVQGCRRAYPPKGSRPWWLQLGSFPDFAAHGPHPRFREELFSELGHPLWPFPTFLWCYVTLPGLLALLALCLVQFYQSIHLYYIAWDSSAVRLPHPGLQPPPWGPLVRTPLPGP